MASSRPWSKTKQSWQNGTLSWETRYSTGSRSKPATRQGPGPGNVCVLNVATMYEAHSVASVPLHSGARNHSKVPIAKLKATVQTSGRHHAHAKASVLIGSNQSLHVLP